MKLVKKTSEKLSSCFVFEFSNRRFTLPFIDSEIFTPKIVIISGSANIIYNHEHKQIEFKLNEGEIKDIGFLDSKNLFIESGPTGFSYLGIKFLDDSDFSMQILSLDKELFIEKNDEENYYFCLNDNFFYKDNEISETTYLYQPPGKDITLTSDDTIEILKVTKR